MIVQTSARHFCLNDHFHFLGDSAMIDDVIYITHCSPITALARNQALTEYLVHNGFLPADRTDCHVLIMVQYADEYIELTIRSVFAPWITTNTPSNIAATSTSDFLENVSVRMDEILSSDLPKNGCTENTPDDLWGADNNVIQREQLIYRTHYTVVII